MHAGGVDGSGWCKVISLNVSEDSDDPVQVYLREIGTIPPLTIDEEIELSHHVRAHDEQAESAGHRLVEANLALVVTIARRHQSADIHLLELTQKGNDGLLLALKTFADTSGKTFTAYAAECVEQAIAEAIGGDVNISGKHTT